MRAFPLIAVALAATPALAHDHPTVDDALMPEAGVVSQTARFTLLGYPPGSYLSIAPWVNLPLVKGFWVRAMAPVNRVSVETISFVGLGDLMTAEGWQAFHSDSTRVDVSVLQMWPTGDPHKGLGSAHLMVMPTVEVRSRRGPYFVHALLGMRWAVAWGQHGEHNHITFVDPHDVLDLTFQGEAGLSLGDHVELAARLDPTVTLIANPVWPIGSRLYGGAVARVHGGMFFGEAGALFPISQNRYEDWQLSAGAGARF